MASSSVSENWPCIINGDHDHQLEQFELSDINGSSLLMSLLEDSQAEVGDLDDGKLISVIQSLEAEINFNTVDAEEDFAMEHEFGGNQELQGRQLCNRGVESQECPTSQEFDFSWIEMEASPSSPMDEMMTNWYVNPCRDEMDGLNEFEGLEEFSEMYYALPLEEHGYSSLWQETYNSVMYS